MKLSEILAFGVKSRATEITLAENAPVMLLKGHEPLRLNVPPPEKPGFFRKWFGG